MVRFKKIFYFLKYKTEKNLPVPEPGFIRAVYLKTIICAMKNLNKSEITISSVNICNDIPLLEELFDKNISFSLGYSGQSHKAADYFLKKFGFPVSVVGRVKRGLYVYLGGEMILTENQVPTLDLSGDNSKYFIRNTDFPVKINSLPVLSDALRLTGKNLSDIIIKPCIILKQDE